MEAVVVMLRRLLVEHKGPAVDRTMGAALMIETTILRCEALTIHPCAACIASGWESDLLPIKQQADVPIGAKSRVP
jgi:hypothetical protein